VHDIAADRHQMLVFGWRLVLRAVWIGGGGGGFVNCACGEEKDNLRVIFFDRRALQAPVLPVKVQSPRRHLDHILISPGAKVVAV
jgi:hypothetical protein